MTGRSPASYTARIDLNRKMEARWTLDTTLRVGSIICIIRVFAISDETSSIRSEGQDSHFISVAYVSLFLSGLHRCNKAVKMFPIGGKDTRGSSVTKGDKGIPLGDVSIRAVLFYLRKLASGSAVGLEGRSASQSPARRRLLREI